MKTLRRIFAAALLTVAFSALGNGSSITFSGVIFEGCASGSFGNCPVADPTAYSWATGMPHIGSHYGTADDAQVANDSNVPDPTGTPEPTTMILMGGALLGLGLLGKRLKKH